jgi:hypothetical protein
MKCDDLNAYITFHINPYKIVTTGKINFIKQFFNVRIKVPIFLISYMAYSKLYDLLLDWKKVVISIYFNVTIYIEFELLDY